MPRHRHRRRSALDGIGSELPVTFGAVANGPDERAGRTGRANGVSETGALCRMVPATAPALTPSLAIRSMIRFPFLSFLDSTPTLAIDLGRRRLQAMLVRPKGSSGVEIVAAVEAMLPESVDADDTDAVGAWVAATLAEAGIPRRPAVVALPREQVGLKTMNFPSIDQDELPGMVRIATQRELPMDGGEPAIDFIPLRREGNTSTLLVAAAPARTMKWVRSVMRAAGISIARISVRTLGVGALVHLEGRTEPTLVLDLTGEGLELALITAGDVRFSRGVTIPSKPGEPPDAEAVVTEVRRSWVSYRIGAETEDARDVLMLGSPKVVEEARPAISTIIGRDAKVLAAHPSVEIGDHQMGRLWPLAGLLAESRMDRPHINLAHPRREPDLAARKRQRGLLVAGALIVVAFGGHTLGSREAQREDERIADLRSKAEVAAPEGRRIRRDMLKLVHLEAWTGLRRDWVEDLLHLKELMPEPGQVVADTIVLSLENPGVSWHRERGWSSRMDLRVSLEGEAATRTVADAFREALVQDERFVATTSGSDARGGRRLPFPFGYVLRASRTDAFDEQMALADGIATGAALRKRLGRDDEVGDRGRDGATGESVPTAQAVEETDSNEGGDA